MKECANKPGPVLGVPIHTDVMFAVVIRAVWSRTTDWLSSRPLRRLELFAGGLSNSGLSTRGDMAGDDLEALIPADGQVLSDLMKKPVRLAIGRSPDDQELGRWLSANKVRRDVTHGGTSRRRQRAQAVVGTIQDVLRFLGDSGSHLLPEMPT